MCSTTVARRAHPIPERPLTQCREPFPSTWESMAFPGRLGHPHDIETTAPPLTTRHASAIAAVLLVLSVSAAIGTLWVDHADARAVRLLNDPLTTVSELLCFGVVGAVLISRRPDLPFGWVLGLGAAADIALVGIGVPSLALAYRGGGGQTLVWGVCLGVLQWVPTALEGVINVRFPSGRPSSRWGYWLDRALCVGIPLGLVGTYLGNSVTSDLGDLGRPLPNDRFVDGTWVTPVGDAALVLVPVLILLGILAGIGVIVRCFRATGIEREQLQWRAAGAAVSLLLFPLVVSGIVSGASMAVVPLVFVSTLVIPVLRYQLWSGDPVPRRRRVGPLVSRRTLIEAQEEERRRLRRDLHDGLGPMLTGLRLTLDAVQAQFVNDPAQALEHLATAREASAEVISDLRGLVHGLRPPALDELGLAGSLRLHLASLVRNSPLEVTLDADEHLAPPAAVEVAVYRSASEAVTNVMRHSTARRCQVAVATSGRSVVLTVDDDGHVFGAWQAGVGLTSMRERAVELGGTFIASSGPSGFHIKVTYPRK
jgi:signal transduction histidine kinase